MAPNWANEDFPGFSGIFHEKGEFFGKKPKNDKKVLSGRLRHIFLIFSTPEVLGGDFDTTRRDLMGYNQAYDQKKWGKGP